MSGPRGGMIEILEFKPLLKNTLRGFVSIRFPFGLVIKDITIHTKGGREWCGMPSKPQLDREGKLRYDDNGKLLYANILEWRDRDTADRFSATVIRLVREKYPNAEF